MTKLLTVDGIEIEFEKQNTDHACKWCVYLRLKKKDKEKTFLMIRTNEKPFTRFTYNLHENNVNFLDHSPGNTLIKKVNGAYEFYLVDLNRMSFGSMSFEKRIKNFAKLSTSKHMIAVMSDEYAKCIGEDSKEVENLIWQFTQAFQNRRNLKKKLKFLKKK